MEYESMSVERLIEQAAQRYRYGDYSSGIEYLKEALSIAPDHGFLHSYLSNGLIQQRRLGAALHEAQLGLELEPNHAYSHFAVGNALLAKQKYKQSIEFLTTAVSLEPENEIFHLVLSRNLLQLNKKKAAEAAIKRALELAPGNCDVLAEYGDFLFTANQIDKAASYYNEALMLEPQHIDALIGAGNVLLKRGNVSEAREHAIWALQQDPNYAPALLLLTSIKAKSNPIMGLWWRLNSWLVSGNNVRTILLLMLAYLLFQITTIVLVDSGQKELGNTVSYFWLGIVIYTWIGPSWFNKKLKSELETVTLNKDY